MKRVFISPKELIEQHVSNIEKRCVSDVVKKNQYGDKSSRDKVSRAFAICRSSMQKSGNYAKNSMDLTKKGAKKSSAKGRLGDNKSKVNSFERMIKAARQK